MRKAAAGTARKGGDVEGMRRSNFILHNPWWTGFQSSESNTSEGKPRLPLSLEFSIFEVLISILLSVD